MAAEGQSKAFTISQRAASAVRAYAGVAVAAAGSQLDDSVIPGASGVAIVGVTRASHAANDSVEVITYGIAKMIAGASIGAGAPLVVGSLGAIVLVAAQPSSLVVPPGLIGTARQNAVVGDIFSVLVNPNFI
jgi:hypothetical protein